MSLRHPREVYTDRGLAFVGYGASPGTRWAALCSRTSLHAGLPPPDADSAASAAVR